MATMPRTCEMTEGLFGGPLTTADRIRKRILIVDDDPAVLEALRRLFDSLDADVKTCSDPLRAVELFAEESFDVVISDERMPKMSGLTMLAKLRATSPRTPTIDILVHPDASTISLP